MILHGFLSAMKTVADCLESPKVVILSVDEEGNQIEIDVGAVMTTQNGNIGIVKMLCSE